MMTCSDLTERLERIAQRKTIPFCISCHVSAVSGRCTRCGSDDLGNLLPGVGLDWGRDWAIRHLIAENVRKVDVEDLFTDWVDEAYGGTVKVGWLELDVARTAKEMDPISWRMALSDWLDDETSSGTLITLDDGETYFMVHDVEAFVDENDVEDDPSE